MSLTDNSLTLEKVEARGLSGTLVIIGDHLFEDFMLMILYPS